ncbi:F0F1 ATP synthase subunit delta [Verminephrobacter aporrectodeae subsp. tuberculatae]|uniref:ATP synthase subunit delta n=1 Tax=Verminephrobacter aporrectodeae subsp. tuberculatae TaxID=1110392 RepID=A0ABT3KUP3_9BURK|nr:F0F1 ATP synthase subunit delta [Verminephrobacter aporrectodeae]MCW5322065.1 F0F1 ATP synthase subunit delta [Verminephrobacter aporrectodeae subsp. tuberculatae]
MAELATIARPYAEALFQATTASGADADPGRTAAWLDELAAIAADPQLRQLANDPKVTADQVFAVFSGVVRSALSDAAKNFLRTVIANRRTDALAEMAAQFHVLVNRRSGFSDAVVYSAFPMDGAALSGVGTALEKRFGRKLHLVVRQDVSLIGGIRVVVGDEVLDTSVKARLEQMKAVLVA